MWYGQPSVRWREIFGKPVFQVCVLALVLKFSVRSIFGKHFGIEVTENQTPKISAFTVDRQNLHFCSTFEPAQSAHFNCNKTSQPCIKRNPAQARRNRSGLVRLTPDQLCSYQRMFTAEEGICSPAILYINCMKDHGTTGPIENSFRRF